ncbi:putative secreted protein [Wickerhamomyces ciferrii]|uniref:Secreted protein n=1 Tax=Wickerhamomyces ciferrii (strain ATCC 14091 / BCRC 22168 / CBS 111 / JCM 3599 / NBRC 0793 / NRRL Y-1031 F-60-10) TaxID=1206466 RepID=K0KRG2_WICCF|nr:uncharacterized protein BN7_4216 [Wickerhamomyces ciferrii]CCH44647.1 putative secreted protein [Wickerhamomyces ciferrii]
MRQSIFQTAKRLYSTAAAPAAQAATSSPAAATTAAATTAKVVSKPAKRIGAFRGGFLGFFFGVSLTSIFTYSYVLDQHKTSSNVIISDVLSLQKSIRVLEEHVRVLEKNQKPIDK